MKTLLFLILVALSGYCYSEKIPKPLNQTFIHPQKLIGKPIKELSKKLDRPLNRINKLVYEDTSIRAVIESKDALVSYIEIDFKLADKCYFKKPFNSEPFLSALNITQSKLEKKRMMTHSHTYYDHTNKLKVVVSCVYDGGVRTLSLSKKYYGH